MKKIKKLIVAILAMAMVIGCFAVQASAAEPTNKTVYLVVAEDDESNWAMNYWSGLSTDAATANIGWGDDNLKPVFTKVQDGLLKMNVTVWSDMNQGGNGIQIVSYVTEGANTGEYKACADEGKNTYWDAVYGAFSGDETEIWLALDYEAWTVKTTTPVEIKKTDADFAAEAETVIDEAIALEATKANKDKYDAAAAAYGALTDAQKALVDADKVTELNAGVKAIADIIAKEQAEEDAKNAGTLTVYVKSPGWTVMNVYGWDGAEFGEWPGKSLTALKANEGWFSVSFDITKATNLIFNDNKTNNEQTVNWEGVKAGTYWLVLSEKDDKGMYLVDAVSTTAPEGWKEEAAEKVEQELPSTITTVTEEEIAAIKDSVKVEGSNDKLVVAPLSAESTDVAVITTALSKELKGVKFIAADLKFESGKQPAEGTKITIDVTKFDNVKAAKFVAVYSVKDGKLELVDTVEVKDGKITFAPKHFSTYVFAEADKPTGGDNNNTGDDGNVVAPPAGVPAAVVVASVSLMLAAVVAVIASKKRVTE